MAFPALRHFRREEFDYPDQVDPGLLQLLDEVRERAGVPIKVTSDRRTLSQHEALYPDPATRPNSPHVRGHGIDFKPMPDTSENRMAVLHAILDLWKSGRWPRLGLEIATRHLHCDNDPILKRPHLWIGTSR